MCGEVVAAPLSLQDTVYPILRKKSLHFCEKSKKFLKLCTAVRKEYKMKRLRRSFNSLRQNLTVLPVLPSGSLNPLSHRYAMPAPPKGELFEVEVKFLIAFDTLATGLTACALSVKAYGFASSPKGRAKSTAGSFLITLDALATNFTAWLPPWGSWRGSA